jgi:hypothetical protein
MKRTFRLARPLTQKEAEHLRNSVSSIYRHIIPKLTIGELTLVVNVPNGINVPIWERMMEFIQGYLCALCVREVI